MRIWTNCGAPACLATVTRVAGIFVVTAIAGMGVANAQLNQTGHMVLASNTSQSSEVSAAYAEAVELFRAGRDGNKRAVKQAIEAFDELVEADDGDVLSIAYLGASYALLARDSGFVVNKTRYANRGLRHLDAAVEMAPDLYLPRLLRANVQARLPGLFGRKDSAIEDMLLLDEMFTEDRRPDRANSMATIYDLLLELAPEAGDWEAKAKSARQMADQ